MKTWLIVREWISQWKSSRGFMTLCHSQGKPMTHDTRQRIPNLMSGRGSSCFDFVAASTPKKSMTIPGATTQTSDVPCAEAGLGVVRLVIASRCLERARNSSKARDSLALLRSLRPKKSDSLQF